MRGFFLLTGVRIFLFFPVFLWVNTLYASDVMDLAQNTTSVRYVIDGDTFITEKGVSVRLIGINAPEMKKEKRKAEPYAEEAKKILRESILKKNVSLVFDQERYDSYKRLLAYVYLKDGRNINELLIEKGAAFVLFKSPNTRYYQDMLTRQRFAMSTKTGIWKLLQSDNQRVYRGNKSSRRFHLSSCPLGKKTHPKNLLSIKGHWKAFYDGYAPAKCCLGHLNQLYLYPDKKK